MRVIPFVLLVVLATFIISAKPCCSPPCRVDDPTDVVVTDEVTKYDYGYTSRSQKWGTIEVWSTMLLRRKLLLDNGEQLGDPKEYANRLKNNVEEVRETFDLTRRFWDFFALNETYYSRRENFRHVPADIPCGQLDNAQTPTVSCYDAHLRKSNTHSDHSNNTGSVAFIANQDTLAPIPGTVSAHFLKRDDLDLEALSYPVTGARFKIIREDDPELIIPMYSVKLPTIKSSGSNRMSQVVDLVQFVKNDWVSGDMTPIIVGDFNFAHHENYVDGDADKGPDNASDNLATEMKKSFFEAGMVVGGSTLDGVEMRDKSIEAIWVGKEESFPGALGTMAVLERRLLPGFANTGPEDQTEPGDISDHPALYGRLQARIWDYHQKLQGGDSPLAITSDSPNLFSIGDRLYMSWSERTSNKYVRIIQSTPAQPKDFSTPIRLYAPGNNASVTSDYAPALTYFNTYFYVAWVDTQQFRINVMKGNQMYPASNDWTDLVTFPHTSDAAPALIGAGNTMWVAWKEQGSDRIYYALKKGDNWVPPQVFEAGACSAPTLAHYKNRVYMAWVDCGQNAIHIQRANADGSASSNGNVWNQHRVVPEAYSTFAPALMALHASDQINGKLGKPVDALYLLWSGKIDNSLRVMASPDGIDWSHAKRVLEHTSLRSPSLTYFNYRHVIAWNDAEANGIVMLKTTPIGGELSIDRIF